ncbi:PfkB family carbohydrate kinase [uncultured Friedmanniella sp.]|uniref:PfkB family carbohydrate kinase n=1 Tax=uncultured Friedmanniella sp. TaxID=335381 RepID=UPI0035C9B6DD
MLGTGSSAVAAVVCVGGVNLDHVFEIERLPTAEGKELARSARVSGGGLAATAAVAISRLGGRSVWCGCLGDDDTGLILAGLLKEAGVVLCDNAVVPGARTPEAVVLVAADGARWIGFYGDVPLEGQHGPPKPPDLCDAGAVLTDQWSPALSLEVLATACRRGIPRVFDVERPDWNGSGEQMALSDHVIFADAGLRAYTGIADPVASLQLAAARLPHATVAVTRGSAGSLWWLRGGACSVSAPTVRARDTTGAGDVFHGAYALGLAEGLGVEDAAVLATAAAAVKVERGNGWDGMPSREDTSRLIEKGWT